MNLPGRRAGGRIRGVVDERFDAGHPVADAMRSYQPEDVEMDREARERLVGHLLSIQRTMVRGHRGRGRAGWKTLMVAGVAAATAVAVALLIMLPGTEKPVTVSQVARTGGLIGNVEVKRANCGWREAADGESLEAGDAVRTGEGSSAAMAFPDGSVVRIDDGSEVGIRGIGEKSVTLEHARGGTYHRVCKGTRYTVTNQDISSRALGTAFNVDNRSQGDLEILTVESAVEVSIEDHGPIKVAEGEVMVVSLSGEKKAVKQPVSRERLAEGRLRNNVRQDAQEGYDTGIYKQVDVEPGGPQVMEESGDRGEDPVVLTLEGAATGTGVSLNWNWSVPREDEFNELVLLRSEFSRPEYPDNEIARYSDVTIRTANDDSVTGGRTYQYRIAARSSGGDTIYSNTVVISVPVHESEPEKASISLTASFSANGVVLGWSITGVTVFDGYVVERLVKAAPEAAGDTVGRVEVTRVESSDVFSTRTDSDVAPGYVYEYRVGLVAEGAVMVYSNSAEVEIPRQ